MKKNWEWPKKPPTSAKLSLAKARDIRVKRNAGATVKELAMFYRVSINTIYRILARCSWKEEAQ